LSAHNFLTNPEIAKTHKGRILSQTKPRRLLTHSKAQKSKEKAVEVGKK
jgi:hypothetical protein